MSNSCNEVATTEAVAIPATRASSARAVLLIIVIASLCRLAVAAAVGLSVDESYTVAIGRQLALSYFDHPPLHVWLVGGWAKLIGNEDPLLLRLPFVVLFAGSTWLMYRLTAFAYGERAGLWAVVAFNLAPLFTLGIASWVLPDGPLVFFCLLAVRILTRALLVQPSRRSELAWWLAAGAAAGLALLSKYLAVFLLLGVGLFLLTSRYRYLLATPAPWLALLVAALLFTPVLAWNAAHAWTSFAFQGGRALPAGLDFNRFALDLCGQFAYLLPWTALALVYALGQALRRGSRELASWLFACLAIGPIALFALQPLWSVVLPHWPAIGWTFAFPLLGELLARLERTRVRLLRWSACMSAAFLVLLFSLAISQARTGWIERFAHALAANDPTVDVLDWRGLKGALAKRGLLQPGIVLATVSWIDAGKVDYALAGDVPVLCLSQNCRQFAFLRDPCAFEGRNAIIVANARRVEWRRLAEPYFRRVEPLADLALMRAGKPAIMLKIARGQSLRCESKDSSKGRFFTARSNSTRVVNNGAMRSNGHALGPSDRAFAGSG